MVCAAIHFYPIFSILVLKKKRIELRIQPYELLSIISISIGKTKVRTSATSAMVSEFYLETISRSWEDSTSKRLTQA